MRIGIRSRAGVIGETRMNPHASARARISNSCSNASNSAGRNACRQSSQSARSTFDGKPSKYSSKPSSSRHSCAVCKALCGERDIDETCSCERVNAMAGAIRTDATHGSRRCCGAGLAEGAQPRPDAEESSQRDSGRAAATENGRAASAPYAFKIV